MNRARSAQLKETGQNCWSQCLILLASKVVLDTLWIGWSGVGFSGSSKRPRLRWKRAAP